MAPEKRRVVYQRRAAEDVREAVGWYDLQRVGLGDDFLAALKQAEDVAATQPRACAPIHRDTRRVLLRRFPYGLYFRLKGDSVIVIACYHGSRNPTGWRSR